MTQSCLLKKITNKHDKFSTNKKLQKKVLYKDAGFVVVVVFWVSRILWIDSTMLVSVEPEEQPPSNYETA